MSLWNAIQRFFGSKGAPEVKTAPEDLLKDAQVREESLSVMTEVAERFYQKAGDQFEQEKKEGASLARLEKLNHERKQAKHNLDSITNRCRAIRDNIDMLQKLVNMIQERKDTLPKVDIAQYQEEARLLYSKIRDLEEMVRQTSFSDDAINDLRQIQEARHISELMPEKQFEDVTIPFSGDVKNKEIENE